MAGKGTTENVTLKLNALLNPDGITAGINKLQNSLKGIDFSTKAGAQLKIAMDNLLTSIPKLKGALDAGFKDNASLKSFTKDTDNLRKRLLEIANILSDPNQMGMKIEMPELDLKSANLTKLNSDLKNVTAKMRQDIVNVLSRDFDGLGFGSVRGKIQKAITTEMLSNNKSFLVAVKDQLAEAKIELAKVQEEMASAVAADKKPSAALRDEEASIKKLIEAYELLSAKKQNPKFLADGLFTQQNNLKKEINKIKADIQELEASGKLKTLPPVIQQLAQMMYGLASATGEAALENHNLTSSELEMGDALERTSQSFKSRITQLFGLYNIYQLIRRGIQQAYTSIKQLDSAMNEIAVVTDMTTNQLWGQIRTYMEIAKQYGVSTQGVYEVSKLYFQQGRSTAEAAILTAETLKMAKIANLDYAKATDNMTVALNGFKMSASDSSTIVDVYSQLAAKSAVDTEELAYAMSKTASIAESAGMSFQNTSVFLAQMIETTREAPENIGTAMKTIIARFQEMKKNPLELLSVEDEEVSFNRVDGALQSIGMSLRDANNQFRDLDGVIYELADKWNTLDRNTQRYIATIVAGSRQQSRFLALMQDSERLKELKDEAEGSEDAGLIQYSKTLDGIEAKLNQLSTSFQEFYMSIINGPVVKSFIDAVRGILDSFNSLPKIISLTTIPLLIVIFRRAIEFIGNAMIAGFGKTFGFARKESDGTVVQVQSVWSRAFDAIKAKGQVTFKDIAGTAKTEMAGAAGAAAGTAGTSEIIKGGVGGVAAGIGGVISSVTSVIGVVMTVISVISTVAMVIDLITENTEEKLDRLKKAVEDTDIERAKTKDEVKTLDSLKKKYDELSIVQDANTETRAEWLALNNEIAEKYPELIKEIDNEGNYIVALGEKYDIVYEKKKKLYNQALVDFSLAEMRQLEDPDYKARKYASAMAFESSPQKLYKEDGSSFVSSAIYPTLSNPDGTLNVNMEEFDRFAGKIYEVFTVGEFAELMQDADLYYQRAYQLTSEGRPLSDMDPRTAAGRMPSWEDLDQYRKSALLEKVARGTQNHPDSDKMTESVYRSVYSRTIQPGLDEIARAESALESLGKQTGALADRAIMQLVASQTEFGALNSADKTEIALYKKAMSDQWEAFKAQGMANGVEMSQIFSGFQDLIEGRTIEWITKSLPEIKANTEEFNELGELLDNYLGSSVATLADMLDSGALGAEGDPLYQLGKDLYDELSTTTEQAAKSMVLKIKAGLLKSGDTQTQVLESMGLDLFTGVNSEIQRSIASSFVELASRSMDPKEGSNILTGNTKQMAIDSLEKFYKELYSGNDIQDMDIFSKIQMFDPTTYTGLMEISIALEDLYPKFSAAADTLARANFDITDAEQFLAVEKYIQSFNDFKKIKVDALEPQQIAQWITNGIFNIADFDLTGTSAKFIDPKMAEAKLLQKTTAMLSKMGIAETNELIQFLSNQSEREALQKRQEILKGGITNIAFDTMGNPFVAITEEFFKEFGDKFDANQIRQTLDGYEFIGPVEDYFAILQDSLAGMPGAAEAIGELMVEYVNQIMNDINDVLQDEKMYSIAHSKTLRDRKSATVVARSMEYGLSGDEATGFTFTGSDGQAIGTWDAYRAFFEQFGANIYEFNTYVQEAAKGVEGLITVEKALNDARYENAKEQEVALRQNARKFVELMRDADTYRFMSNSPKNEEFSPMYALAENMQGARDALDRAAEDGITTQDLNSIMDFVGRDTVKGLDEIARTIRSDGKNLELSEDNINDLRKALSERGKQAVDDYNKFVETANTYIDNLNELTTNDTFDKFSESVTYLGTTYEDVDTLMAALAKTADPAQIKQAMALASKIVEADSSVSDQDAFRMALKELGITDKDNEYLSKIATYTQQIADNTAKPKPGEETKTGTAGLVGGAGGPGTNPNVSGGGKNLVHASMLDADRRAGSKPSGAAPIAPTAPVAIDTAAIDKAIADWTAKIQSGSPILLPVSIVPDETTEEVLAAFKTLIATGDPAMLPLDLEPKAAIEALDMYKKFVNGENTGILPLTLEVILAETALMNYKTKVSKDLAALPMTLYTGGENGADEKYRRLKAAVTKDLSANFTLNVKVNFGGNSTKTIPEIDMNKVFEGETPGRGGSLAGGGIAKGGYTLVGELGRELRISNGSVSIVGQRGPEFVDLKPGDGIVPNWHTEKILAGKKNPQLSGQMFSTGTSAKAPPKTDITGNKFDSVIFKDAADSTKKVADNLKDANEEAKELSDADFDRWYNFITLLEKGSMKISELNAARENLTGAAFAASLMEENRLLNDQIIITKSYLGSQKKYLEQFETAMTKQYPQYFKIVNEALEIDWPKLMMLDSEAAQPISDLIDEWGTLKGTINGSTEELEGFIATQRKNQETLRDAYLETEQKVINAIKYRQELIVKNLQEELAMRQKYDAKYLESLRANVEKERAMRSTDDATANREQAERKLAMLRRDTSGKSNLQIAAAEKELRSMNQEAYDARQDEFINQESEASAAAQEKMQSAIDAQTDIQRWMSENISLIQAQVDTIMNGNAAGMQSFIEKWTASYINSSPTAQLAESEAIKNSAAQAESYLLYLKNNWDISEPTPVDLTTLEAILKSIQDKILTPTDFNEALEGGRKGPGETNKASMEASKSGSSSSGSGSDSKATGSTGSGKNNNNVYYAKYTDPFTGKDVSVTSTKSWADAKAIAAAKLSALIKKHNEQNAKGNAGTKGGIGGASMLVNTRALMSSGGLATFTGPAILHGTDKRPERVLSATQTQSFERLVNMLDPEYTKKLQSKMLYGQSAPQSTPGNITVNVGDIILQSGVIGSDYDVQRAGRGLREEILKIARHAGTQSLSRT